MPLVAVWLVALVLYLWLQRDLTFVVDEGDWITFAGTSSVPSFLESFNGHLILLPLLVFRLLLDLFGTSYVPFTLTELLCLFSLSLGLFVFANPRIGPVLALLPSSIPFFLGAGWPLLLTPLIGIEWILSISLGLWALILASRGTFLADLATCLLLAMSLATFSIGLSFLVACGALILLVRREPSKLWIPAVPFALYLLWTLVLNQSGASVNLANLPWLPIYSVDAVAAAGAALLGQQLPYGPGTSLKLDGFSSERLLLFLAEVGLIVGLLLVLIWSYRRRGNPWGPLLVLLAIPIVLFSLQGLQLAELRRPVEARYLPAAIITISLPLIELCRGVRPTRTSYACALAIALLIAVLGLQAFRDGRSALVGYAREARATILALTVAGDKADPDYTPSSESLTPQAAFMFFQTSTLQRFAEKYGNPGFSYDELIDGGPDLRQVADTHFVRSLELQPAPASPRECSWSKAEENSRKTVSLSHGTVTVGLKKGSRLSVGRFASSPTVSLGPVTNRGLYELNLPSVPVPGRWHVLAPFSPVGVCQLPDQQGP